MINPIVYRFIKKAYASDQEILDVASQYYDNDDPEDPKRRWDHVLDDIEVAKKIRGRDLTPVELGTLAFHDSGYKNPKGYMWGLKNHPKLSRKILLKEAPGLGFKDDEIKHMAKVISYHMRTPKKGSPLLKDDLQMLMFGADEGTPKKPVDDARKYFMKAIAGRYPEVPDKSDPQFIKKLVERVRTFKDYSNAPGLEYYHRVYPNYHRDLYNYWHSDQIIKDYEKMLEEDKKGKSLKQKSEKKKNVKKASKLYTYVDPDADLSKGLLSVKLAPEDVLLRRYSAIVKDLKDKNKDAIIKHFEDPGYGPRRTDLIFALDAPIPDNANEELLRFRDKNKLVSWDPEQVKDLISVVRRRHSPKRLEEVPANFEPLKHVQWGRKPKDSNKRFLYAPSYKVLTESGRIPPELLTIEKNAMKHGNRYTVHKYVNMLKTAALPPIGSKLWQAMLNNSRNFNKLEVPGSTKKVFSLQDPVAHNFSSRFDTKMSQPISQTWQQAADTANNDAITKLVNQFKRGEISLAELSEAVARQTRGFSTQMQLGHINERGINAIHYGTTQAVPGSPGYTTYMQSLPVNVLPAPPEGTNFNAAFIPFTPRSAFTPDYPQNVKFTSGPNKNKLNELAAKGNLPTMSRLDVAGVPVPNGPSIMVPVNASPAIAIHEGSGHGISAVHPAGGAYLGNGSGVAGANDALLRQSSAPAKERLLEEAAADNLGTAFANTRYRNLKTFPMLQEQMQNTYPLQYRSYVKSPANKEVIPEVPKPSSTDPRTRAIEEREYDLYLRRLAKQNELENTFNSLVQDPAAQAQNAAIFNDIAKFERSQGFIPLPTGFTTKGHQTSRKSMRVAKEMEDMMARLERETGSKVPERFKILPNGEYIDDMIRNGNASVLVDHLKNLGFTPREINNFLVVGANARPTRRVTLRRLLKRLGLSTDEIKAVKDAVKQNKERGNALNEFMNTYGTPEAQKKFNDKIRDAVVEYGVYPETNVFRTFNPASGSVLNYADSGYTLGDAKNINKNVQKVYDYLMANKKDLPEEILRVL